jgi:hypothetical protein
LIVVVVGGGVVVGVVGVVGGVEVRHIYVIILCYFTQITLLRLHIECYEYIWFKQ